MLNDLAKINAFLCENIHQDNQFMILENEGLQDEQATDNNQGTTENNTENQNSVEEVNNTNEENSEKEITFEVEDISTTTASEVEEQTQVEAEETLTSDANQPTAPTTTLSEDNGEVENNIEKEETTIQKGSLDLNPEENIATTEVETTVQDNQVVEEVIDYSILSKEELLEKLKELEGKENLQSFGKTLKIIKESFDPIIKAEKQEALDKFIADGGEKDDFDYNQDEATTQFYDTYKRLQNQRAQQRSQAEEQKEKNLKKKEELLTTLRSIVDGEESEQSIEAIKEIQTAWKEVGPVTPSQNNALWASYNALMDRFYNNRSIYFELKELDRKKSLTLKIQLSEKAEGLAAQEFKRNLLDELNKLHEEWKHIGPVPKEEQELIWQRFKAASDTVYQKRNEFYKKLDAERQENLKLKLALCEKAEANLTFNSEKITDWNKKTEEVLALQKEWEAIRQIPRDKIKEVSKRFWTAFKQFFQHKNEFFQKIDEEREENWKKKVELCEKAEQALANEEVEADEKANILKGLQREWKTIGPAPRKKQNIYDRFKKACDEFFEGRRQQMSEEEAEFVDNLKKKQAICEQVNSLTEDMVLGQDENIVDSFVMQWKEIGFVPRRDKVKIEKDFQNALKDITNKFKFETESDKDKMRLAIEIKFLEVFPHYLDKIFQKKLAIRKKINEIEDDLATLENNLGFFANSKTANSLKDSFVEKEKESSEKLEVLKAQIKMINKAEKKYRPQEPKRQDDRKNKKGGKKRR